MIICGESTTKKANDAKRNYKSQMDVVKIKNYFANLKCTTFLFITFPKCKIFKKNNWQEMCLLNSII